MISTHPSRVMTWWWRQTERDTALYWPEEQKSITSQLCPLLFFPPNIWQTYPRMWAQNCAHSSIQTPRAHCSQMQHIFNSVFKSYSSEESLWCPSSFLYMCVCVWVSVHVCARGLTQLFHVATMLMSTGDAETWKRQLSSAKPMIRSHPNVYTSAAMTRYSCQRTRKNIADKCPHTCMCVHGESYTDLPNTHTHTQTQRRLIRSVLECSPCSRLTKEPRILRLNHTKKTHCASFLLHRV